MTKINSIYLDTTNNADGFDLSGGTTVRKITVTGADMTLTGSGTNTFTFPAATDTLVGRASTDTLTNKTLIAPVITGDLIVDTDTLYVDSTNNRVGIGTASPTNKLDIAHAGATTYSSFAANIDGIRLYNSNTTAETGSLLVFESGSTNKAMSIISGVRDSADNSSLRFQTENAGTIAEAMRISPAGYLGIGVTAPTQLLDLKTGGAIGFAGVDTLNETTLGSAVVNSSLTSVGTIGTGVWNGTDIAVADGGTGRSLHTEYAVLCGGTTTTAAQQSIAGVGASGEVLTSNGAGALPTFQSFSSSGVALGDSPSWTGQHDWKYAGVPVDFQNTTDAASNQVAIFRAGNRTTPTNNDQGYISFYGDDDLGNSVEYSRMLMEMDNVTNTSKYSTLRWYNMYGNVLQERMSLDSGGTLTIGNDIVANSGSVVSQNARFTGSGSLLSTNIALKGATYGQGKLVLNNTTGGISAGNSAAGLIVVPAYIEASSGNIPLIASAAFKATVITSGAGTVSDTATVYIEGAATATVSGANYSLWVDDGPTQLDGTLTVVGTTTLATSLTGVLRADSGVVSTDTDVTDLVSAASTTLAGKAELATTTETDTGTDTARVVTPDGLAGSIYGTKNVEVILTDNSTAPTVVDGLGDIYFIVPAELDGMNLVSVGAHATTVSSSGLPSFQIHNLYNALDMLSTNITLDASEKDSATATTAAVINTSNDHVNTGDEIRFDCDVVGTGTLGITIRMGFRTV